MTGLEGEFNTYLDLIRWKALVLIRSLILGDLLRRTADVTSCNVAHVPVSGFLSLLFCSRRGPLSSDVAGGQERAI